MADPYAQLADPNASRQNNAPAADPYAHLADPYAHLADPNAKDAAIRQIGLDPNASGADIGSQVWKQATGDKDDSMTQAITGAAGSLSEIPAMIGGVLHRIGGTMIGHSGPITDAFKEMANTKRDTTSSQAGALFETMAEWIVGEGPLKALTQSERMAKLAPVVKTLEKYPKLAESALAHPEIVKHLPDAIRQGILGATQTAAHGDPNDLTGTAVNALKSGVEDTGVGLAIPALTGAARNVLGGIAKDVMPTTRMIEGVPVTELASEARGPSGEIIASKRAQKAAQYGSEPALVAERQGAFKQIQTNLAKKGIGNALGEANANMAESGVSPNIQAVPGTPTTGSLSPASQWRYIPPDGSAMLTADETRSAMNEVKQQLLDKNWSPDQEQQLTSAYDDMKQQLDRQQTYHAAQPTAAHDVDSVVNGTNNYRDAADYLKQSAQKQFGDLSGKLRQQYTDLLNQKNVLQDEFDAARSDPNKRNLIMEKMDDVHAQMDSLAKTPEAADVLGSKSAMQPFTEMKLANAFDKLQNTMDQHFNLRADTAEKLGRARTATKLNSLSDHIEQIKSQYGDVLNPVLGPDGLDHITELGDMLNQPTSKVTAPKTYLENLASVGKKYYAGGRGAIAGGGALWIAHLLGSHVAGPAGGLGVLGTEAAYRRLVNRMATDPEFAMKIIDAAKANRNPKIVAPLLGLMTSANLASNQEDRADAASQ